MYRRLYFLLPDRQHALSVVEELEEDGIDTDHMHALGDRRTPLGDLPNASLRQEKDTASHLEKLLWNSNLASFSLALSGFIALLIFSGLTWWLLLPLAVMAANFLAGLYFTGLPNTHLGEFRDALGHGEILLMVDVPENQVARIENRVHHQHPEATVGGVGWGTEAFGL
jgi:hypothetical protein